MKNFIIFGFMVTVITLTSCSSNEETSNSTVPTSEITAPSNDPVPSIQEDNYYSIKTDESSLIQLRNDEKSVREVLGKPLKETTPEPLGDGADTFSGMYSKTLEYDGLTLKLLGKSAEELWLSEIELSSNKYATSEGIKVGDSLNTLLNAYPNIKYLDTTVLENKPNSKVYGFRQGELGFFADFVVDENEKIEAVHMYFVFD
ncbi:hypothetical protein P4H42_21245 [Paenibacillus macerans]|uniref:hypothetical protein n=1 Tax=Paenibacillus macerans TaxID=44252 RepID=UPI000EEE8D41|nr:hypothetical protein [Paenibacillus macerans]MEC0332127.1 hypothetical protein [Paenibacillus macerans]GBK64427.1 hypothetical protein PbDSM24746_44310 [Paenibacillus macerans]GBK70991.1 hypothetical protein PbJCM17693_46990 [Paenibacillus macerans]